MRKITLCAILMLLFKENLFSQGKFLSPKVDRGLCVNGGFSTLSNSKSTFKGFSIGLLASKKVEFGIEVGSGKTEGTTIDDSYEKVNYTSFSPYIELIGRSEKKPISASLRLFYLGYISSYENISNKNFGFSASVFKDIELSKSFLKGVGIIPEFSVSKVINFDGNQTKPTVSGLVSIITNYHNGDELFIKGQIGKNGSSYIKVINFGILFDVSRDK